MSDEPAKCDFCGQPATCSGVYGDAVKYACDDCCEHNNDEHYCASLKSLEEWFKGYVEPRL